MKRTIRQNVFETNSSSMHTVTIKGKININPNIYTTGDCIKLELDEYGWSGDPCDDFRSKLAYALSMVLNTEYPDYRYYYEDFIIDQEIMEGLDGYKLILDAINKYCPCAKIIIKKRRGFYPYGYIDHQSYEYYHSLRDFLEDWNVDIERFLFDDNVVVYILNDNG